MRHESDSVALTGAPRRAAILSAGGQAGLVGILGTLLVEIPATYLNLFYFYDIPHLVWQFIYILGVGVLSAILLKNHSVTDGKARVSAGALAGAVTGLLIGLSWGIDLFLLTPVTVIGGYINYRKASLTILGTCTLPASLVAAGISAVSAWVTIALLPGLSTLGAKSAQAALSVGERMQSKVESAMDHVGLKQAVQALETGRKAEAQTMLAHIVKDEPDNEMAWLWLAVSLDEPQKKRFALDRALAINPKSKMGLKIKQSLDKPAAAQAPNQVAASHPAMQIRRAANALETGQQAQAQTILAAIVKQDARNEHAWLWLAASLDDLEKKRVCVQKALAINPQSEAGQRMIQALAKPIIPPLPPLPAQPAAKPAAPPARRAQPDTMWTRYKALFKRKFFPRVIIFIILVIIVNVCNWLSSLLEG